MKQIIFLFGILLFFAACTSQKGIVKVNRIEEEVVQDSLEYELETFDVKFESWYQMYKSPATYRSQQYYENWNQRYVSEWNYNSTNPQKSSFFEPIVGYDPHVDYGFELNHELFYYFQYVEHVLKIQIISGGGPRSVVF